MIHISKQDSFDIFLNQNQGENYENFKFNTTSGDR